MRWDEELDDLGTPCEAHVPSVETVDDVGDLAVDMRLLCGWNLEEYPQAVLVEDGSGDLEPS